MEKAYDPKDLVEKLKGKGLSLAEEGAKDVVGAVFDWVHESAQMSPNPYDDLIDAAAMPQLKKLILEQVDKIDGKVG